MTRADATTFSILAVASGPATGILQSGSLRSSGPYGEDHLSALEHIAACALASLVRRRRVATSRVPRPADLHATGADATRMIHAAWLLGSEPASDRVSLAWIEYCALVIGLEASLVADHNQLSPAELEHWLAAAS